MGGRALNVNEAKPREDRAVVVVVGVLAPVAAAVGVVDVALRRRRFALLNSPIRAQTKPPANFLPELCCGCILLKSESNSI